MVASPVGVCTETLQHRDMGILQGMPGGTRPARRPSHMRNGKRWGAACRPAPLVIYTGDRAQCASPGCSACRAAQRVGDTLETCLTQAHRKRSTANSQNSEQCRQAGTRPPTPIYATQSTAMHISSHLQATPGRCPGRGLHSQAPLDPDGRRATPCKTEIRGTPARTLTQMRRPCFPHPPAETPLPQRVRGAAQAASSAGPHSRWQTTDTARTANPLGASRLHGSTAWRAPARRTPAARAHQGCDTGRSGTPRRPCQSRRPPGLCPASHPPRHHVNDQQPAPSRRGRASTHRR